MDIERIRKDYEPLFESGFRSNGDYVDLFLLEKYVAQFYKPSNHPACVNIGLFSFDESELIRLFHQRSFQIPSEDVKILGCNYIDHFHLYDFTGYNHIIIGKGGDASKTYIWDYAQAMLGREKIDFVYIRNPDARSNHTWLSVYKNAQEYLSEDGVIVTLVREHDITAFEKIISKIDLEKPFFGFSEIDVDLEWMNENVFHTLCVMKKK